MTFNREISAPGTSSQFGFGEQFANSPTNAVLILALEPSPRNETLHRVEQFQPILQRWFLQGLPLIEPALSRKESPIAAYKLGANLQPHAFCRPSSPIDFSFRHRQVTGDV